MLDRIGPYQVTRELGRGGMGVVFLATDPRLGRDVAIKALPAELGADPARLDRFEREARTLASLNHPNLAGLLGLEEQDGARYLVLEYVAGESLADRLDRGPIPPDEAVEIAAQVAAGMQAAHDVGVIHRDLKPANIMVTPEGGVKVLDFGLARTEDASRSATGMLDSPTLTAANAEHSPTIEGAILGTAAYMSPEQARGRRVDRRTDIWSFGVVLYEMLVGSSPFRGETASDSIGAVLHKHFDLDGLPPGTPPSVRAVLERCLVRDVSRRYRDIGDVRLELLRPASPAGVAGSSESARGAGVPRLVAVLLVVATAMAAVGWRAGRHSVPEPERLTRKLDLVTATPDKPLFLAEPKLSPDGRWLAFVRNGQIHLRGLTSFDVRSLPGTEGATRLQWSPDGAHLAFSTGREMKRISIANGGVSPVCDIPTTFEFAWTEDDRIVFASRMDGQTGVLSVPARGGSPTMLIPVDEQTIDFHAVGTIPGTNVLVMVRHLRRGGTPIEAWDGERTVTLTELPETYLSSVRWSPSGHLLFTRGFGNTALWALPMDPEAMAATGDPFLVMTRGQSPSVASNGTLSVLRGSAPFGGELIWAGIDGSIEVIGDGGSLASGPLLSPDGTRIVYAAGTSPEAMDLWVRDLERGVNSRIAVLGSFVTVVSWSPDGTQVAAAVFDPEIGESSMQTIFVSADGSGPTREPFPAILTAFTRTWTTAVRLSDPMKQESVMSAVDLRDDTTIGTITTKKGGFALATLDPDESLLVYQAMEDDVPQIFCTQFPSGEGRWQVSSDGGRMAAWAPDGSAVYYLHEGAFYRVRVTREPAIRFGVPELVLSMNPTELTMNSAFSVAPDGERFLLVRPRADETQNAEPLTISVIDHWYEEFRADGGR